MNIDCVKNLLLAIDSLFDEKLKQNDSFPLITADQICNKLSDKGYTFAEIAHYIDELNTEGLINSHTSSKKTLTNPIKIALTLILNSISLKFKNFSLKVTLRSFTNSFNSSQHSLLCFALYSFTHISVLDLYFIFSTPLQKAVFYIITRKCEQINI